MFNEALAFMDLLVRKEMVILAMQHSPGICPGYFLLVEFVPQGSHFVSTAF